jgi:hypothetical protein
MNQFLKNIIRDTPFFCALRLKLNRHTSLKLPCANTDLHIAAFPRCANTFSRYICKNAFPSIKISTHIHTIATVKSALKYNVPTICIVREPANCLTSLCLKRKLKSPNKSIITIMIKDYLHYHSFIFNNKKNITIIPFNDVISDPTQFLTRVGHIIKSPIIVEKMLVDKIVNDFKVLDSKKQAHGSSMPNAFKETEKIKFHDSIVNDSLFKSADQLYLDLIH